MKVLILGASSDIGLAVCEIYLSKGWSVLAHYRTSCLELQRLVNENPDRIELIKLEFEIPNDLEAYIQCNQDKICECDALINCAAMYAPDKFSKLTSSNLIHTFSVNVIPGLIFMKNMAPKMTERNWGGTQDHQLSHGLLWKFHSILIYQSQGKRRPLKNFS